MRSRSIGERLAVVERDEPAVPQAKRREWDGAQATESRRTPATNDATRQRRMSWSRRRKDVREFVEERKREREREKREREMRERQRWGKAGGANVAQQRPCSSGSATTPAGRQRACQRALHARSASRARLCSPGCSEHGGYLATWPSPRLAQLQRERAVDQLR
jgi:hypothetical protein